MGNKYQPQAFKRIEDWDSFGEAFTARGSATRTLHIGGQPVTVTLKRVIAMPTGYTGEVMLVALAPRGVISGGWLVALAEEVMRLQVIGRASQDTDSGNWTLRARLPNSDEEVA